MREDSRICILGMGYVGVTLAAAMCDRGFRVHGVESAETVLHKLQRSIPTFFETGLPTSLARAARKGQLTLSARIPDDGAFDVFIITVGTPLGRDGRPRMDMVSTVASDIAKHMKPGAMVVVRSTVRLGTTLGIVKPLLDATGHTYDLATCPERTSEGNALNELFYLPQVVGAQTHRATVRATELFRRLTPTVIAVSSIAAAEAIKLLDNSYRDLFFAFGNEVAMICEAIGIDAHEVILAANTGYERTNIAKPGLVGGPCLEKDPHILFDSLRDHNFDPTLLKTGRRLNESMVDRVFDFVAPRLPKKGTASVVLLGIAFKGRPDTDDVRGSAAVSLARKIRDNVPRVEIRAQDFLVSDETITQLGMIPVSIEEAFDGAHAILVMNNHPNYASADFERFADHLARPAFIYDAWSIVPSNLDFPEGVTLHAFGR